MCCVVVEVSSRAIVTAWLFLFNDTATTEIYTLSLHDALPISARIPELLLMIEKVPSSMIFDAVPRLQHKGFRWAPRSFLDRKSTRLNSSHSQISYAVFCLKKKKNSVLSYIVQ